MSKIAIFEHLKTCSEAAKKFTSSLVGELATSVTAAITELEEVKADKSELKNHGHEAATTTKDGFMSKEQVAALNSKVDSNYVDTAITAAIGEVIGGSY